MKDPHLRINTFVPDDSLRDLDSAQLSRPSRYRRLGDYFLTKGAAHMPSVWTCPSARLVFHSILHRLSWVEARCLHDLWKIHGWWYTGG